MLPVVTVRASPSKLPRQRASTACLHISSGWVCLGSLLDEAQIVSIGSHIIMRLSANSRAPAAARHALSSCAASRDSRGGSSSSEWGGCWAVPGRAQATLPEGAIAHGAAQGKYQAWAQQPQQNLQSSCGGPGCKGSQPSQQTLVPGSPAHMLVDQPQLSWLRPLAGCMLRQGSALGDHHATCCVWIHLPQPLQGLTSAELPDRLLRHCYLMGPRDSA